ncbi:potassium transporter TrkA [Amycolatopsis cihanbeyliensis]|uniref:Potassium transporter TrkA n=1 Tax=Amycolatopsis cihanbeyliensis TaxID=1128664 RepID=A0A542DFF5_AMYCI|nr:potassium transporter TrkA [Amycolatopsis cihanbeyliensis]TQJ01796.1 hypothetical protein FB471_1512 [Amycolatopsis cihanbeyliensis]
MTASLVVLGTGSLANATCEALATIADEPAEVHVIGRAPHRVKQLSYLAGTRAQLAGRPVAFHPVPTGTEPLDNLGELLGDLRPDGVFVCASRQSPWERTTSPSAWTELLERAGFGITLPLQADMAVRAGQAIRSSSPGTWLVNACFPDAVNPVLTALDIPVLCGIGNVGTLAASLQAAWNLPDQARLHLLAHHAHLHPPPAPEDEAVAWVDGHRTTGLTELLATQRATNREALNRVTGYTAAVLLDALHTGAELATHVPGPGGRPGGYPVRVREGTVSLRLPPGTTEAEAVAVNQHAARLDGVLVVGDEIHFEPTSRAALAGPLPELADGFGVTTLSHAGATLLELRTELRSRPHPEHRRDADDLRARNDSATGEVREPADRLR